MEFPKTNKYRIGFLFILLTAGFLSFWGTWNEGWSNAYYSSTVKSMLSSWHNFFYASFDPAGYVSVDKPALGLWLQCLSATIFGLKGWALILPQALASVVSVGLLYKMIEKPFGKLSGLLAGFFLAITPIFTAVGRTNNLDATLIMFMMFAAYFVLKAVNKSKFKFLLISVAFTGLGFNVKMIQAFMILPAIYLVYIVFGKIKISRRILHLFIATILLLTISFSWCIAVDLTPEDKRPYVGSSSNNSAIDLAIGYNGIMRVIPGIGISGGMPTAMSSNINPNSGGQNKTAGKDSSSADTIPQMPREGASSFSSGSIGFIRLLDNELGGQIGWLLPIAISGLLVAAINARKRSLAGSLEKRQSLLFWGSVFIVMYLYFSFGLIVHGYYTATIAPAISAMAALGINEMWKAFKTSSWTAWLLPLSITLTGITQFVILLRYSDWISWLSWIVLIISITTSILLTISKFIKNLNEIHLQKITLVLCITTLLISPALWTLTPVMYGSNPMIPSAGPELSSSYNLKHFENMGMMSSIIRNGGIISINPELEKYLLKNYNNEKYLVAAPNANTAGMMILDTGKAVMAVGGFIGSDKILTVDKLKEIVNKGELRYYLVMMDMPDFSITPLPPENKNSDNKNGNNTGLPYGNMMPGGNSGGFPGMMDSQKEITDWVKTNGTQVPDSEWKGDSVMTVTPTGMAGFGKLSMGMKLYDLKINSSSLNKDVVN